MRMLMRFISLLSLALAVGVAGLDTIRSIARSMPDLTSVQGAIGTLRPEFLSTGVAIVDGHLYGEAVGAMVHWVLMQPVFAVLLVQALLFWMAGYKKIPAAGRFAA